MDISKIESLDSTVVGLAMSSETGDKELNIFRAALESAINQLKGNDLALSEIAKAVKSELDTDMDIYNESDINSLNIHIGIGSS